MGLFHRAHEQMEHDLWRFGSWLFGVGCVIWLLITYWYVAVGIIVLIVLVFVLAAAADSRGNANRKGRVRPEALAEREARLAEQTRRNKARHQAKEDAWADYMAARTDDEKAVARERWLAAGRSQGPEGA